MAYEAGGNFGSSWDGGGWDGSGGGGGGGGGGGSAYPSATTPGILNQSDDGDLDTERLRIAGVRPTSTAPLANAVRDHLATLRHAIAQVDQIAI